MDVNVGGPQLTSGSRLRTDEFDFSAESQKVQPAMCLCLIVNNSWEAYSEVMSSGCCMHISNQSNALKVVMNARLLRQKKAFMLLTVWEQFELKPAGFYFTFLPLLSLCFTSFTLSSFRFELNVKKWFCDESLSPTPLHFPLFSAVLVEREYCLIHCL